MAITLKNSVIRTIGLTALLVQIGAAEAPARKPRVEPEILSASPMSATRGTRTKMEVRGKGLAETHAVLFDCSDLTGEIKAIEEKSGEQNLTLEISIAPQASHGVHTFRLVSPMGVTSPRPLLIHDEVAVPEESLPMDIQQGGR